MKPMLLACATSLSVDQQTSNVSLFNLIEQLNAPSFPFTLPDFRLVAINRRDNDQEGDPTDIRLTIELEGTVLANTPFSIPFKGKPIARAFAHIGGLVVANPGLLTFCLRQQKKKLMEWTISIKDMGQVSLGPSVNVEADSDSRGKTKPKKGSGKAASKKNKAGSKKKK